MRELSLFSGAGGGLLGTKWLLGWRTVGYVEWEDYPQRVLAARIKDGLLDDAPIFGDVNAFIRDGYARSYQGMVDVISAGFPCQPFSVAGQRRGDDDPRNQWPATIECIRVVRPRYAFLENVPGLLTSGYFGTILSDLSESGYDARWRVLSAAELGAPHKRDRLWIVAYAKSERKHGTGRDNRGSQSLHARQNELDSSRLQVADASGAGLAQRQSQRGNARQEQPTIVGASWWSTEPDVGRTFDGLA